MRPSCMLMDYLEPIVVLLLEWRAVLITILVGIVVIWVVYSLLLKRQAPTSKSRMLQQLFMVALVAIFVITLILQLPIGNTARGQLLSLLGILVAAAIALSSTTLLGNAMAGLMLRSLRNFRAGDFIIVEGIRGRVSELTLLRTEIQTERRELTTLPNLYLVTNPVTVVRSSGTFISATVSLGYDIPREKVEKHLLEAAENAGLSDPFTFVLQLGDFSVTYQAAGFLEEVKYLISAESKLRANMLDALHGAGIEIVSPTFMNQRQLSTSRLFIPESRRVMKAEPHAGEEAHPEERMFDKAELAETESKAEQELKDVVEELDALKKADEEASKPRIRELEARLAELAAAIKLRQEQKEESNKNDGED